jgi:hypothetical protein
MAGDDGALRQEAWAHWGIRMDNVAMLFVCLAIGMSLRKFRRIPDNAHTTINAFIINVALPALVLQQIHDVKLDPALVYAVLMPAPHCSGSWDGNSICPRRPQGRLRLLAAWATPRSSDCR